MSDKKERVWGNLPFDGHVTRRKPCVWDNPRGARSTHIHTQNNKKNAHALSHARTNERSLELLCFVSPGRRLADHWAKDSDLSAGYILVPEIVTDVIYWAADWSVHCNQDVNFGLFHFTYWLPAGLINSPTTSSTQVPCVHSAPFSPSTYTHAYTHPCQMPKCWVFLSFFHVFPYYSRPWIIITLVVNLFSPTCLARP